MEVTAARRQPRSVRFLVHQGRGHPRPAPPGGGPVAAVLIMQPPVRANGTLYAVGRAGRPRRAAAIAEVRRRLWALRILVATWAAAIALLLWFTVTWFGWYVAAFTHPPMLILLLVLLRALRAERRWLVRLSIVGR